MKRGLVFSLCALALAAFGSTTYAQTLDVSLNLRYNDPADPTEGGTFTLVGKVNNPGTTKGIAAVNAYLSNINTTGLSYGTGVNSITNGGAVYATAVPGGTNLLYGQDTSANPGTVVLNIGAGAGQVLANDPLKNAAWNGATVLITGTFTNTPAFVTSGANTSDGNLFAASATANTPEPQNAVVDANTTFHVRGDSIASLGLNSPAGAGLLRGDADRSFKVDGDDLNQVLANFNQTGKTWAQGDFTDGLAGHVEGKVDGDDLNLVLAAFNQSSSTPPAAISSVPEPATMALAGLAGLGLLAASRRK